MRPGVFLAFIDADCRAHPRWLHSALQTLCSSPEKTILGGDVRIWRNDKDAYTAIEAYEGVFAYRFKLYIERHGFCGTGNLVVRRADFERIGPFAGIRVAEDIEWGQRALSAGFTFRYVPEMIVFHPARRSLHELYAKWDRHIQHFLNMARGKPGWKISLDCSRTGSSRVTDCGLWEGMDQRSDSGDIEPAKGYSGAVCGSCPSRSQDAQSLGFEFERHGSMESAHGGLKFSWTSGMGYAAAERTPLYRRGDHARLLLGASALALLRHRKRRQRADRQRISRAHRGALCDRETATLYHPLGRDPCQPPTCKSLPIQDSHEPRPAAF